MTENLPNVPQAYQPPVSVPVDPYQPPPSFPPPRRGLGPLVFGLGLALAFGVALVISHVGHSGPESAAVPAAAPVATAPAPLGGQELPALPASAESTLTDATDGASTSIHFTNETAGPVTVMWLDYDHKRVKYMDLEAGQGYDQQTYAGHVWIVTRADGSVIALYQAVTTPATAVVR